jgi:subtilisin-like proprotein convertase family protein
MITLDCPFSKNAHRSTFLYKKLIAFAALTIFIFTVSFERATAQTFVNPAPITIFDNGPAIPAYPSTLNVTGTFGRITKVVVTLNGFTHSFPDDVGVLLVGPAGQKVRLMSDVGGGVAVVTPVNIPIDDRGAAFLPDNAALTNVISKPTQGLSGTVGDGNLHAANFPAPAPAGPYSVLMSDFIGTSANGTWSLYVDDDTAGDAGTFANGWTLTITTGGVFTNSNAVSIPDSGTATPYPSTIAVAGFTGNITKVSVRLNSFSHTFPDDVGVLLVGPTGTAVRLTTDNGGDPNILNIDLLFDDSAANALPDNAIILSTSYRPTQGGGGHPINFPAPAPVNPYSNVLSAFNGSNPNGIWSLYVDDDAGGDTGSIANGWTLAIEAAAPTAADSTISGRAVNASGRGLGNVRVMLYGGNLPYPIYTQTNPFGYYRFENMAVGQTYVMSVSSKRYSFTDPVRVINLSDDLFELDFFAEP